MGNINKYNKGYQQAETSYKGKNYPEAIKQLNALLQDPAIKNKEYTEIFANVNKLLVTATEAQYKISSQNTQSQNNTQQSTPPKLTNGKQVTQQDIVKARQQIDQLNVDGIKAQNCSDPDVVNVINAALKNHNSKDLTAKDIKDGLHLK
ncbi:hypothetical protein [Xylocopilactobacillus apis]|uniref:Uncharacterized protein n=1 Tax=Xylocopilactobacillus apis TaxID=2932183 RepID=A0AAU9DJA9_9LACO|nr:hypothetical protein [Xylocopilactobacillus apis]BDR55474.1 hypothetical protein KIMC2_00360 [Xylocopilactobacillus apis]